MSYLDGSNRNVDMPVVMQEHQVGHHLVIHGVNSVVAVARPGAHAANECSPSATLEVEHALDA